MIYADHNATTPPSPAVLEAMAESWKSWGNPSSTHAVGRKAEGLLENARTRIAQAIGVESSEIVFTSGGSEANSMVILGHYLLHGPKLRLLTSPVEHSSIQDVAQYLANQNTDVRFVKVNADGAIDLDALKAELEAFQPHLLSLMAANNETGVLFPTQAIHALCQEHNVGFHTDAVQAFGKLPPAQWNGADFVSVSAHKIYGPKGVGALIVKRGKKLVPTHFGGAQEIKRRGGTQNMVGIAGFAAAADELAKNDSLDELAKLHRRFEEKIKTLPDVYIQGEQCLRLPNTSNIRFAGVRSEVLLSALDIEGLCISAGSACSAGSISPSHVLIGMGLSEKQAEEAVRFSWGIHNTPEDIDTAATLVINHVNRIRARRKR